MPRQLGDYIVLHFEARTRSAICRFRRSRLDRAELVADVGAALRSLPLRVPLAGSKNFGVDKYAITATPTRLRRFARRRRPRRSRQTTIYMQHANLAHARAPNNRYRFARVIPLAAVTNPRSSPAHLARATHPADGVGLSPPRAPTTIAAAQTTDDAFSGAPSALVRIAALG